jgi:hypothetical protein
MPLNLFTPPSGQQGLVELQDVVDEVNVKEVSKCVNVDLTPGAVLCLAKLLVEATRAGFCEADGGLDSVTDTELLKMVWGFVDTLPLLLVEVLRERVDVTARSIASYQSRYTRGVRALVAHLATRGLA